MALLKNLPASHMQKNKRWDPSSPEEQEKLRQGLTAQGWTINERLGGLVPPGTTEKDVDKMMAANQERSIKFRQDKETSNQFILWLITGLVVSIWMAPWLWMLFTAGVAILGIVVSLGGYKGPSDEGPGGAGKMGPF